MSRSLGSIARQAVASARNAACTALFRAHGVDCGAISCLGRMPRVHGQGTVRLGRICLRGSIAPVELGASHGGELTIGDGSYLNQGCSIVSTLRIDIGEGVRIADFAAIYDTGYHPVDQASDVRKAPVVIEDNVWIGRGAIVLPGVRIGTHSVVAAGAVVTTDVPERTLVAGNPARAVRALAAEDGWRRP